MPKAGILNGKLPGQEDLRAIPVGWKIGHLKASAAAINDGMRLAGIEDHSGSSDQGNALVCHRKMHVKPTVFTQEEIAKCRAAILRAVMVILCAAADHQGDIA